MLKVILAAISFLLFSVAGYADVYVWRDAQGVLNYSDTPPPEDARDVKVLRIPRQLGIGGAAGRAETLQRSPATAGGAGTGTGSLGSAPSGATTAAGGAPSSSGAGGAAGGGGSASGGGATADGGGASAGGGTAAGGGGTTASGGATTAGSGTSTAGGTTTAGGGTSTAGGTTTAGGGTSTAGGTTAAGGGGTTTGGTTAAGGGTSTAGGTTTAGGGTSPSSGTTTAGGGGTTTGGTTAAGGGGMTSGGTTAAGGGSTTAPGGTTRTTFSSTNEEFPNPERGLSRMWSNLSDVYASWLVAHRNAGYRLVTHRQSLSKYVNTATLPQSFLNSLNAGAALHRANGTKMVMQFTYGDVVGGPEPTLTTILGHIAQLEPFFTANADVIAAVHGGFLGTYGEWAFSREPSVGNPTPSPAARAAVHDALMSAVDGNIQVGWRYVADLMTWYPIPLNESQAFTGTNQARSGVHNDCFLSNKDDSGTYWAAGVPNTGRTLSNPFRAYHAQVSNWTTMGGENCGNGEFKACADVLNDGPLYNWRYLRDDWGTVFHDGWKAQGCYPEIKRSLGYRFQLDAISHPQSVARGGAIDVEIDLRNVGWARIFSARKLVVTLKNKTSGALITGSDNDMRVLPPQATSSTKFVVAVAIPAGASSGDYDVYVSMPDIWPATKDKAYFAVRFANADDPAKGQSWEAANFRFKTGTTLTVQ